MKLALECPTELLELVQPFADFNFILAHLVLQDETYRSYHKENGKLTIIDNSVNELGAPVSLDDMGSAKDLLGGGLIVAPDWMGDCNKTIGAYLECVEKFGEGGVVGVIQGQTRDDILKCLDTYKGMIAVPYDILSEKADKPEVMALRRALVVLSIPPDRYVHLLGFNTLDEFSWYGPNVMSLDTGVPVWLGLADQDILDGVPDKTKPTWDRMKGLKLTQERWTAIIRNIGLLRRYLNG